MYRLLFNNLIIIIPTKQTLRRHVKNITKQYPQLFNHFSRVKNIFKIYSEYVFKYLCHLYLKYVSNTTFKNIQNT